MDELRSARQRIAELEAQLRERDVMVRQVCERMFINLVRLRHRPVSDKQSEE